MKQLAKKRSYEHFPNRSFHRFFNMSSALPTWSGILLILLFLFPVTSEASHFKGGQITYKDLGSGTYAIEVKSYWRSGLIDDMGSISYTGSPTTTGFTFISRTLLPDGITHEVIERDTATWGSAGTYEILSPSSSGFARYGGSDIPGISEENYPEGSFQLSAAVVHDPGTPSSSPQFFDIPVFTFPESIPISLFFLASDPESDPQQYSLVAPSFTTYAGTYEGASGFTDMVGESVDSTTGEVIWTSPTPEGLWIMAVKIEEMDGGVPTGAFVIREFTLYITTTANDPPVLTACPTPSVVEGATIAFTPSATDPDVGDDVTIVASGIPLSLLGATFSSTPGNPATSSFSWTTGVGDAGVYSVSFTASDNGAPILSDVEVCTLTVTSAAPPPPPPPPPPAVVGGDSLCQKILPSDGEGSDRFGKAVAINGPEAIVGAHRHQDNGRASGAAYVYTNMGGTWMEEGELLASDGDPGDQFGSAVDISGDYAIVGAHYDDKPDGFASGSAYIFHRSGGVWSQQAKLVSSDIHLADLFGFSVSICDSYAVVGALGDDDLGGASGSAYVFKRVGVVWTQVAKLNASDGDGNDYFGFDVDINMACDDIIVGAHRNSDDGTHSGSAYIFHRTGSSWSQTAHLKASDAAARDSFGFSVDLYDGHAIIGAPGDDDSGSNSGSAYIFENTGGTWTETDKLVASDGEAHDLFGWSVGITNGIANVGAWGEDEEGTEAGASYVYLNSGGSWFESRKLIPAELEAYDHFGFSSGVSGDFAIIGAKGDDDIGSFGGAAYICLLTEPKDTLFASDAESTDRLGFSSDIKGTYAIAGAPNEDAAASNAGAAYVYHKMGSDWPQQSKLTASDGGMNDNFGWSTGITDNYAIAGAPNHSDAGFASGAAYIYERTGSTWTELAKLLAPTPKGGDFFGYSVAIADEYAVVGALGNDDEGTQAGAAYVYMRSGSVWTLVDTLYATDPDVNDYFGFSVDIDEDGENIIVGAPRNDDGGSNSGAAYVYHRSGSVWMSEGKLLATDDDAQDSLGFSVAIAGDYAIAGAIGDDETASNAGAAYIFNRSGGVWSQQEKLMASDGSADDLFGYSVGTDGMWAAVGAPFEDDSAMNAGALYAYMRSGSSWTENAKYKAADPDMNDEMGFSSAVSDGRAIVGIPGDDTKAPNAGAACIINLSGSAAPAASPMLVPDNEDNFLTSLEPVNAEEEAGLEAVADEETEEEIGTETIENRIVTTQLPYPNPTRGEFNFMLHSDEPGDVRLEIVSMSGKLVLRDMLQVHQGNTTHRIDLSREKGGIYLVNLFFSNGERVMHRVVIQR